MLLIAKIITGLVTSSQTYTIHQAFRLEKIAIQDLSVKDDDSKCAFEILTAKRPYVFVVDHEVEKKTWLEELQLAIYAIHMSLGVQLLPGWQHNSIRGTFHSCCLLGDHSVVSYFLNKLRLNSASSPDIADASGMCPIHWAALSGHTSIGILTQPSTPFSLHVSMY